MILPTYPSKLRHDIEHWAGLNKINLDIAIESQDISVKKLMACSEMGLLPAASHTVTRQVLSGELIEIGALTNMWEELFLISARRKIENDIAKKLMETFQV